MVKILIFLNLVFFTLLPKAFSCAVCFGQVDTPMTRALNWGIVFMLGVLMLIFTGFFAFIYQINQRTRRLQLKTVGTKSC